jgi:uncharacterized protein YkwD
MINTIMQRLLRRNIITFLTILFILSSSFLHVQAATNRFNPIIFIKRATDIIVNRVSDLIYYMIMQKKYVFDDFVDPNTYTSFDIPADFEQILTSATLGISTTSNKEVTIPKKPIEVATTTIPPIKKTTSPVVPVQEAPPPVLILNPAPVPAPSPLPVPKTVEKNVINNNYDSDSDILIFTNKERESDSLKPLSANRILDRIAALRADDLFTNQYFEHTSPDGTSASEIAKDEGYDYLLIGENLALGNFDGERGIVSAWMDSPGHRANILNGKFTELGVSVKEGQFKGDRVTIAVQIFGLSMANCSKPNPGTKTLIQNSTANIKKMQEQAQILYKSLDEIKNSEQLDRTYYSQKIQEYNYFAKKVNDAIISLKEMADAYNKEVGEYNSCISSSLL